MSEMADEIVVVDVLDHGATLVVENRSHDPAHEYDVGLNTDLRPTSCTCPHHEYRSAFCKHMKVAGEYAYENLKDDA